MANRPKSKEHTTIQQLLDNSIDKNLFLTLVRRTSMADFSKERAAFKKQLVKKEVTALYDIAKSIFGHNKEIKGGLKRSELRYITFHYLKRKYDYTFAELGDVYNLTYATVMHGNKIVSNYIHIDSDYQQKYLLFMDQADQLMESIHLNKVSKLKFTLTDNGSTDITN